MAKTISQAGLCLSTREHRETKGIRMFSKRMSERMCGTGCAPHMLRPNRVGGDQTGEIIGFGYAKG